MLYYLILGNKSEPNIPSEDMISRVSTGCRLFCNRTEPCKVILSGANGEAELMEKLILCNIPTNQLENCEIVLDKKARNTINSFDYIKEQGVNYVGVITSDYHVLRTRIIMHKMKCHGVVIGAHTVNGVWYKALLEVVFTILTILFPIRLCRLLSKLRMELHLK